MTGRKPGLGQKLRHGLRRTYMSSGPYARLLDRRAPTGLVFTAKDPWPGDPDIANDLFRGRYDFAGEVHTCVGEPPWPLIDGAANGDTAGTAWSEEVLSFSWLRHFTAADGATAARQVQALIDTWINTFGVWHPIAWRADVLAQRIIFWLGHANLILGGVDAEFRDRWLGCLSRQFRHLANIARKADPGVNRMRALAGVVVGGLCLPGGRNRANSALKRLLREIERQILADGGHVSRSPSSLLAIVQDLVIVRAALLTANRDTPYLIQNALDRMGPMLGLLRHGDGRLALFNGGFEEDALQIDTSLGIADAHGAALVTAPHAGYHRMSADDATVIVDGGAPPRGPLGVNAHAGTLSFEMSVGPHRMVVNCGAGGKAAGWGSAGRASAAHSTLIVDDTSSSRFRRRGRRRGQMLDGPRDISVSREENHGSTWLDLEHDGYGRKFGLVHRRRLYLEGDGGDLRGEDIIAKVETGRGAKNTHSENLPLSIRFHLHPDVSASLSRDGGSAVLRLPDGDGWKLRASGGTLALAESIYFGERGPARRTEQIVVTGTVEFGEAVIKWALRRVRSSG